LYQRADASWIYMPQRAGALPRDTETDPLLIDKERFSCIVV